MTKTIKEKPALEQALTDFLSKESLLKRMEITINEVDVPKMGRIYVKTLTAKEVAEHQAQFMEQDPAKRMQAMTSIKYRYVGRCLVDASGNLLFPGEESEKLGELKPIELERLFNACASMNPLGEENEVEKEVKNSETTVA